MAKKLVIPVHPEIKKRLDKWKRVQALIEHDEVLLKDYCLKLPNETVKHYKYRSDSFVAGFINPSMELINAPANTIFKNEIREETEKDSLLSMFSSNCTLGDEELSLKRYMREQVSPSLRSYGNVFLVLDMPKGSDGQSVQAQKEGRIFPYVSKIHPLDVVNFQILNGELIWFAYRVLHSDIWENPLDKAPRDTPQLRVWTKNEYIIQPGNGAPEVYANPFGFVPVIIQTSFLPSSDAMLGDSPFSSSSNSIIIANNHLNTVNVEIGKHATAILLMHQDTISAANTDVDGDGKMIIKTTRDGGNMVWGGDHKPEYLSIDLAVIPYAIDMYKIYMSEAIENEKSARSVINTGSGGKGGDGQAMSGIALVTLRDPVLSNITATASDLQLCHQRVIRMANRMLGDAGDRKPPIVSYDMNYDIRPFEQKLKDTDALLKTKIPSETLIKTQYKTIVPDVIKNEADRIKANEEIDKANISESILDDQNLFASATGTGGGEE